METPIIFNPIQSNYYETWVPVKGYENFYLISSMGRLFDINFGYFCVSYKYKGEKYLYYPQINQYIHIAMMRSFKYFDGCENYYVIHKDGNTFCNYIDNLEWTNNYMSAISNRNCGSNSYMAKYSEEAVKDVCRLLEKDIYTAEEISKITGVNRNVVNGIKYGSSWKHISKFYKFNVDAKAHRTIKYPDEIIEKFCQDLQNDKTLPIFKIAEKYNISKNVAQAIASGNARVDISHKYDLGNPEDRNYNFRNKIQKEKAKELLETTNMTINEIADVCNVSRDIVYSLNKKFNIRNLVPSNQHIEAKNKQQ